METSCPPGTRGGRHEGYQPPVPGRSSELAGDPGSSSPGRAVLDELGFELGDAAVGETDVGACGLEPFFERPVVLGELADALFERGVLGGDPLVGVVGEFAFGV